MKFSLLAKTTQVALVLLVSAISSASQRSKAWVPDNSDGTYKNPVLYADYSDPDVIRTGNDFYLVASSFDAVPGLPILHSRDLVNWELIGHVFAAQPPLEVYSETQHGNGAWAPSIRYHDGEFYVFWSDPDYGIYMAKAQNPAGPWSEPHLIKKVKGWIDPCPLWDDDGRAYLVHAFAASRSFIKSILVVSPMRPDGTGLLDDGAIVYDGHAEDPTVEGPKFYKRNGYYYIAAPAGGVPNGWQLVLRSKSPYGPYERRVTLAEGSTTINGPHQGGWVETRAGEYWFIHFQDRGVYGRVVLLEPMRWLKDWPIMGNNGEPVSRYNKPDVGKSYPIVTPADSDEFNEDTLGLQWQWQANPGPGWAFPAGALGFLRLYCVPQARHSHNLWDVPNLLLQKFPGPEFTVTTKVSFTPHADGERTGLVVMGSDYAYVAIESRSGGLQTYQSVCKHAARGGIEEKSAATPVESSTIYFRVRVSGQGLCEFSYSADGKQFTPIGRAFAAKPGKWIGAKVGLFSLGPGTAHEYGYADYDWFRLD